MKYRVPIKATVILETEMEIAEPFDRKNTSHLSALNEQAELYAGYVLTYEPYVSVVDVDVELDSIIQLVEVEGADEC